MWLERTFFNEKLRVKVGKVDANNEFAYVDNGADFLNYSMSFSPTIFVIPTIPVSATSVNVFYSPTKSSYVGIGVYDGAFQEGIGTGVKGPDTFLDDPADTFSIGEVGKSWSDENGKLPGRLGVGFWRHNGKFTKFNTRTKSGTSGYYLVLDQTIWQEINGEKEQGKAVDTFIPELSRLREVI